MGAGVCIGDKSTGADDNCGAPVHFPVGGSNIVPAGQMGGTLTRVVLLWQEPLPPWNVNPAGQVGCCDALPEF